MWGQTSVRDRSVSGFLCSQSGGLFRVLTSAIKRTINGNLPTLVSSVSATFSDSFPPPVPPVPGKDLPTPASDVFGDVGAPSLSSSNRLKPLPDIRIGKEPMRDSQESDSNSIVVVNMPGKDDSPMTTPIAREFKDINASSSKHTKRRSMSVSDVDVKRTLAQNSPMPPRLKELERTSNGWGSSLSGMFAREFPETISPLSLQDPITPIKRLSSSKGKAPALLSDSRHSKIPDSPAKSPTSIPADTPIVNIEPASIVYDSPLSSPEVAIIPPRSSSLNTPVKITSQMSPSLYTRSPGLRYGPRSAAGWSGSMSSGTFNTGSKDSSKLRIHRRSTASNSEPSLVPRDYDPSGRDDSRHVRLVPSVGSSFSRSDTVSPITPPDVGSTGDLAVLSGSDTAPGEEPDIASKAKSLAARCWTEDEEFLVKEKIAEWLGGK